MRVLLRIQKSDPPTLKNPNKWSPAFNDFIKKCLTKDPNQRPSIEELLRHKFITDVGETEYTSIRHLLTEFKADYVEEVEVITVTDTEEDHGEVGFVLLKNFYEYFNIIFCRNSLSLSLFLSIFFNFSSNKLSAFYFSIIFHSNEKF